jgi:proteasome lid subunit RPN8/RPN11
MITNLNNLRPRRMNHSSRSGLTTQESGLKLIIGNSTLPEIEAHAAAAFPEECCGILIGRTAGSRHHVQSIVPSPNVAAGDRARRYEIDPQLALDALLRARDGGGEVVGFYHSHPNGSAIPSNLDRQLVWPEKSFLIVAMRGQNVTAARSWRWCEVTADWTEERVLTDFDGRASARED